jgi:hypothetical protein
VTKPWIFALVIALPCSVAAKKKPKPLPMPPLVSHQQPISKYACIFTQEASNGEYYFWSVEAYAEYGKAHKRYWSKPLGTFRGTASVSSHNAESAGSGAPIGMVTENFKLGDAEKACTEWKEAVYAQMKKASGK